MRARTRYYLSQPRPFRRAILFHDTSRTVIGWRLVAWYNVCMSPHQLITDNDPHLNAILGRPDLPAIVGSLSERLELERDARQRFRDELRPDEKAEFISGEKIVHSPARAAHLKATQRLTRLLGLYVEQHRLGEVYSEKALICLTRNDYEPDIVFFGSEKAAGFTDDQMEFPAPDFAVEVLSPSTETRDRGIKFQDYADHGVAEYWIVDADDRSIEQYLINGDTSEYRLEVKLKSGMIECHTVKGLTSAVEAIFDDSANADALRATLS